jgi:hypothetical protein
MPFDNSTGVYTPPAAAENAFPGKVIASADWNAIFTDISNAITDLGRQNWTQDPRVINVPGDIAVATTDLVILVQASTPNITLPASSTKPFPVRIMGAAAGIFGTNNSLVLPTGIETISGQVDVTLNRDYQVATFYPLSIGGYVVAFG